MRVIGIIGPYFSGGNRHLIDQNIANARFIAISIANRFAKNKLIGFFCPHNHTAYFERLAQAPEPYYHMLDQTIYDRACEAFIVLPKWENSPGSKRDIKRALGQNKHLFFLANYTQESINKLIDAIEKWARQL